MTQGPIKAANRISTTNAHTLKKNKLAFKFMNVKGKHSNSIAPKHRMTNPGPQTGLKVKGLGAMGPQPLENLGRGALGHALDLDSHCVPLVFPYGTKIEQL